MCLYMKKVFVHVHSSTYVYKDDCAVQICNSNNTTGDYPDCSKLWTKQNKSGKFSTEIDDCTCLSLLCSRCSVLLSVDALVTAGQ